MNHQRIITSIAGSTFFGVVTYLFLRLRNLALTFPSTSVLQWMYKYKWHIISSVGLAGVLAVGYHYHHKQHSSTDTKPLGYLTPYRKRIEYINNL
jgi:hypothetical protein